MLRADNVAPLQLAVTTHFRTPVAVTVAGGGALLVPHGLDLVGQANIPSAMIVAAAHFEAGLDAFNPVGIGTIDATNIQLLSGGANPADIVVEAIMLAPHFGPLGVIDNRKTWHADDAIGAIPSAAGANLGAAALRDAVGGAILDPLLMGIGTQGAPAAAGCWGRLQAAPPPAPEINNPGCDNDDPALALSPTYVSTSLFSPNRANTAGISILYSRSIPIVIGAGATVVVPHTIEEYGAPAVPDLCWLNVIGGPAAAAPLVAAWNFSRDLLDGVAATWTNRDGVNPITVEMCTLKLHSSVRVP
jgi:hypothetical protein